MRPLPILALSVSMFALNLASASPAFAQAATVPADAAAEEEDADEIVVTAPHLEGSFDGPETPLTTLDEAEIAAYGASSLTDLLTALAPQTGSGRGRGGGMPVMLVNGQRITNFREIRSIPPEAIRRVEVLPEEVALRYGYPPNQRVVNLVLKSNVAVNSVAVEYGAPSRGGSGTWEAEASTLRINGPRRMNLTATATGTSPLTEAERRVVQQPGSVPSVAGDPDPAAFRTLIGESSEYSVNASWSGGLGAEGKAGSLSLNSTITRSDNRSFSGLDLVLLDNGVTTALRSLPDPLERYSRSLSTQGSVGLTKPLGAWQLTATLDGGRSETRIWTDRRADTSALVAAALAGTLAIDGPLPALPGAGRDFAEIDSDSATALITLTGSPLRLPAGDMSLTFKGGFAYTGINSFDTRSSAGRTSLRRGDLSSGITLGLPIASRREGVLAGLGDLSLNASAGINRLSDFGTLKDWSAGLVWAPFEPLSLQASYIYNEAAPSLAELGNPQVVRFNVPVYDFTLGQTALASVTTGGNPALRRETQKDIKLGAYLQLPVLKDASLIAEYFRNRSEDVTAGFPLLTPAIEAAFPGRVTRDVSGRIVAIDARSVTLDSREGERLRWGLNLGGPVGKPRPDAAPGGPGRGPRGAGHLGGGGMGARPGGGGMHGGMPGMGGNGQGRWNLALFHTVQFIDRVVVAPGGPVLDLLGGDALSGGGTARHGLELDGGLFYRGFGLRANGSYAAPTHVRAVGTPGSSDLRFGNVMKLDLRLFVNFDQQTKVLKALPLLKGTRIAFDVKNVFDQRQRVTDASGTVPISYQPDLIDPRGRYIGIDVRKMF